MAIYSCNLKSIGRTTHTAGTAGAHIRYIARPEADPTIIAQHMPHDADQARNFIDRAERAARKNARVLDKIRIALPRELNQAERARLVRDFMADLTGGKRVPWFAGIHQTGKDAHNPHVHIAVHDRETGSGKRVLRLSDSTRDRIKAGLPGPKAVEWIRERWEMVCNRALERAGHDARINRRTLKAQGIDREPTIHVGPRASHIDGQVRRPTSRTRKNGCGRVIDYPAIDKGQTRREFNAQIVDLNLERAVRSKNPVRAAWAAFEKDQLAKDRVLERRLARERRARTATLRQTANRYNVQIRKLRQESRLKQRAVRSEVRERYAKARDALRDTQRRERHALKARQGKLYHRLMAAIDITGTARRRQEAARKALSATHKANRRRLGERYRDAQKTRLFAVKDRYEGRIAKTHDKRLKHLSALHERHGKADRLADDARQQREADREQTRQVTDRKIRHWSERRRKEQDGGGKGRDQARRDKPDDALARAARRAQELENKQRRLDGTRDKDRKDEDRGRGGH